MRFQKQTREKGKRYFYMFLILILIFNGILAVPLQTVYGEGVTPGFLISGVDIKINGTPLESYSGTIDQNTAVEFHYKWEVIEQEGEGGYTAQVGDQVAVAIPQMFNLGTVDVGGALNGADNTSYGTWLIDVSESKLILTLSHLPEEQSNVEGEVQFTLSFTLNSTPVEVPYTLKVPISGGLEKEFKVNFNIPGGTDLEKTGQQDATNPNLITWTIDINKKQSNVDSPLLTDVFDSRMLYEMNSLKVYKLQMFSDGSSQLGAEYPATNYDLTTEFTEAGRKIEVAFKNPINSAYRIVYQTRIDPDQIDTTHTSFSYTNNASFQGTSKTATVVVTRGPLIVKDGVQNEQFNADKINWSISINQALYELINPKIEDSIPTGLALNKDSIKVYEMPGKVAVVASSYSIVYDDENNPTKFTIIFNNNITKEYLVEYSTDIPDALKYNNTGSLSFSNQAKLYQGAPGNEVATPATKNITINKGSVITKTGQNHIGYNDDKYIDWKVDVNLAQIDLGTKIVEDQMGAGLKLDYTQGIEIQSLNIDKSNGNITTGALLTEGIDYTINYKVADPASDPVTSFDITFTNNITTPYRIQYRTTITNHNLSSFTNTAKVENIGNSGTAPGASNPSILNTFSKSSKGFNYQTKVFGWELKVNPVKNGLTGFKITDSFNPDHFMTETQFDNIVVKKGTGTLSSPADYTVSKVESGGKIKGFQIDFINEVNNDEYVVTYNTTVDPDVLSSNGNLTYKNNAVFSWTGPTAGSVNKSATPNMNNNAKKNGSKTGTLNANAKQIAWQINVNYLSKNIPNLVVTDDIQGNQRLVEDSLKIYPYTLNSTGGMSAGTEITDLAAAGITVQVAPDKKSFRVEFPANINSPYRIAYSTEFEGISQTVYSNTAKTNAGEDYSTTVNYTDGDKFVEKTGTLNGQSSVDWTITLNKSQSTISSLTITDTLSEGLNLLTDSFVVKNKAGQTLDFNDLFTLDVKSRTLTTDPQVFDLISKTTINETLTIQYRTNIIQDEVLEKKISNSVSFVGEQVISGVRQDSEDILLSFITGSGTGVGEVGSFQLTKVDKDDHNIKLPGVQFKLYKGSTPTLLGTLVTDSNGQIAVNRLKYATYTLEEVAAPSGYEIMNKNTTFTINSTMQKQVVVENEKFRVLELKKVAMHDHNVQLKDSVFEVRKADGSLAATLTTNTTGQASVSLEKGIYKVKEITAPTGYHLNPQEYTVVLDSSSPKVELIVEDELQESLVIKKIAAQDHSLLLTGATFEIRDAGGVVVDTVTTDGTGTAVKLLPKGTYKVKETVAPDGYYLDEQEYTVNIDNTKASIELVVENELKESLVIKKIAAQDHSLLLTGAVFEIKNASGVVVDTVTTDGTGTVVKLLPKGTYTVKETVAPEGYYLDEQEHTVNIDNTKASIELVVTDELKQYLQIKKVEMYRPTRLLSGASFEIRDKDGNVVDILTTDTMGIAKKLLSKGDYTVKELTPPNGYHLNSQVFAITIDNSTAILELVVENRRIIYPDDPDPVPPVVPPVTPEEPKEPENPPVTPETPVTPEPPNKPEAPTIPVTTPEDTPVNGGVTVPDGGKPDIKVPPTNGTVTIDDKGNWTYVPDPNYKGKDEFTITIINPDGTEEDIIIEIDVEEVPLGAVDIPTLPKTGEASPWIFYIIGIIAVLAGISLFISKGKSTRKV